MARKRTSAPPSGELFDRGSLGRSAKPAAPRRARGPRVPRKGLPGEDEDAGLSGPIDPARDLASPTGGLFAPDTMHIDERALIDEGASYALDAVPDAWDGDPVPAGALDALDGDGASPASEPLVLHGHPEVSVDPAPTIDHDFEFAGGVHLTGTVLWFDCERRRDLSFISHAHMEFVGKNRRILATDKTLKILTRGSGKVEALTSPYRRRFTLGPLELEMHPAGHVLGSAQLLIHRGDRRIVYTHDVSTRALATVERAKPIECDVLALPATYGLPMYRFPPREEVASGVRAFVARAFEDNATPVFFAETIGLAQELMRIIGEAGHKMRVQGSIYDVAKIYVEFGVSLPNARRFGGTPARDEVVIFPPILRKHAAIKKLKKMRTAMVSGRAVEPGFAFTQRVDEAFALADVCDHDELLTFVRDTGARDVYLTGGHVEEFGAELRALGLRVFPLVAPLQLLLRL